ncbi:MAG: hypothetical protein OEQ53_08755 [Saprospiraceae bacterium]|nr:hypothetical protein [Saprospiraceae bacterium]
MRKYVLLFGILLFFSSCGDKKQQLQKQAAHETKEQISSRYVTNNILISSALPKLEIKVDDAFVFVGKFDFEIIANSDEYPPELQGEPVAGGDRYVFVSADENQKINKLFIVQFEGFLPQNSFTYNYNFDNAEFMGENKYRHNTWFYDSKKLSEENPNNEGAKTRKFLENKGYDLDDHFMMSRFVGLASEDRKHEIIIFYLEMMKQATGYSLKEYETSIREDEADSLRNSFIDRSHQSFSIVKG